MMDNYEPSRRITADTLTKLDDIHPVKLQEQSDFFNCIQELNINKQNFNFGAEILNTATMSSSTSTYNSYGEEETKTNIEIIKTLAMAAPSTDQLQPSLVEDSQHGGNKVLMNATDLRKQQVNSQSYGMHETNNKEDDEEDSYQTDDNDNSQISQASSQVRSLGGNSAENADEDDDSNDEDSDDSESSDSDFSDLSGLSDMSGKDWKPINQRPLNWVQKQIQTGANPREILSKFLPSSAQRLSPDLTDMTLWRILASMLSEPPRRQKLSYVNTFDDVINLVQKSKNIIVLTGAGVSVSCGIPDFRSSDGIYSRLAKDYPNLPDPQAMFDINYFSRDPRPFFKFAREIYPGQFKPSPCHRFIKMLEQKQKLLRNYTQNIDTLEQVAGIKNVIECHGSFSTASCTKCKYKSDADSIRADIFAQRIPACPRCQPNVEQSVEASQPVSELELRRLVENGIMKPDIVFFGEGLPDEFHTVMASDKDKCDLLIVMGSSLKVRPVALIPSSIPANIPQILINREQLHHLEFDVELLGDGDVIINQICHRLAEDWKDICFDDEVLCESQQLIPLEEDDHEMAKELITSDNDTLSVKSNQSDLALQSTTTTYSDSGFESSSTLSTTMTSNNVANRKQGEFLLPDDLEDPMDSASANATSFAGSCDYRHLSIDSSKDSGILGDLSNPASSAALNLPPPPASCNHNVSNFEDINKSFNMPASSTQQQSLVNNLQNTKTAASNCSTANDKELPCRQRKPQSAAERLHKGTYYVHENSSAYVFPGAQVSWFTDSEDEEEVATCEIRDSENCVKDYEDSDTIQDPLSPLLTPSVENEMVKSITNTNPESCGGGGGGSGSSAACTFANAIINNTHTSEVISTSSSSLQQQQTQPKKRHSSSDDVNSERIAAAEFQQQSENKNGLHCLAEPSNINNTSACPPNKKRRDSQEKSDTACSTYSSSHLQHINTEMQST